ncbi:MAG: chromosomal replication initiator protein DnaA [Deltaproteobacteria bacterium]|nr:chromosomal replication initiator protein DnaA [Deltaproteobacteria bacterium]
MSTEIGIWDQITRSLKQRIPRPEFETWFSQITLNKLDNNVAIIGVPNKFIIKWLRDNYLEEIKQSFKRILKEAPEIVFSHNNPSTTVISSQPQQTKQSDLFKYNINISMTFDSFIIGECNRFAFSSSFEVANRPGNHYNPIYIFSNLSLGKTHLLNAIGNQILNKDPYFRIGYVSSKTFLSDYNYSVRNNIFDKFREKYLNIDILLFDDIQHISNRKRVQEEFLSIFNDLYMENKQIVVTGDRPLNRINNINSQLKSRLGWGLLIEIKEYDQNTKLNIIKRKIKENKINIPKDIISLLVKTNDNIKSLLKNIVRFETYSSLNNGDINISMIKSIIKNNKGIKLSVKDIQSITSGYFNISVSELISDKKKRFYSYPRHISMYLCRKHTDLSFSEIGYLYGDKDHSTIIYAVKKIDKLKNKRKDIREDINNIENFLN